MTEYLAHGWMDEWMNEWMDEWMKEKRIKLSDWFYIKKYLFFFKPSIFG